ncbi:nuclease EXOG, mitochondrial [Trichosurus vulpecula]|uniref:nuclease EXOG, mitochondrial n=1 Tax=Trichosurus vulpecula TaxID=9337 RepID=UPI00186AFEFD|nr:nuclease EXOG, mitochondrial [Trichosurus vulpecula]
MAAGVSRLGGGRRFFSGFLAGAVMGAAGAGLAARRLLRSQDEDEDSSSSSRKPAESSEETILEQYGFPVIGTQARRYTNHALSYDQAKRGPRWVIEHISKSKTRGNADRRHCKFCPDPSIPSAFSADNEDYLGSGWSRGHMAPAGNNKFSTEAMQETFYLSNIVPQNFENNSGYWNRIEMYCRELTERFDDVWVVSGPLTLPQTGEDGKKRVTYEVIGKDNVAVPSHLYKVILARRSLASTEPLVLGAFVVPNEAIGFRPQLTEFQVSIHDLEKMTGIVFFPRLDTVKDTRNLCEVDTCRLLDFREFTLYLSKRKIQGARTAHRLEKVMSELKEAGVEADEHLLSLYREKLSQLTSGEQSGAQKRKSG